ncbi:hypothetical protein GCM10027180_28980 [Microbulbifer echini]
MAGSSVENVMLKKLKPLPATQKVSDPVAGLPAAGSAIVTEFTLSISMKSLNVNVIVL